MRQGHLAAFSFLNSNLSVQSDTVQSVQSQSSYNPFEDEDDTESTVSEKEDNKRKTLVKESLPFCLPPPCALSCALCALSTQGFPGWGRSGTPLHEDSRAPNMSFFLFVLGRPLGSSGSPQAGAG